MSAIKILIASALLLSLNACVLTNVVSMPMRITGAVVSVVPGVGNQVDEAIDTAADGVDDIPL